MKECVHCKISIGGDSVKCPLCQSPLHDEGGRPYWPKTENIKTISWLTKIGVFVTLIIVIVSLALDYMFFKFEHKHFSTFVLVYAVVLLPAFLWYIKNHKSVPRILVRALVLFTILAGFSGWYFDKRDLFEGIIIPIMFCIVLIANFVFCFIKAVFTEDAILCIICNLLIGLVPIIISYVSNKDIPFMWDVTLLLCVITLIAIIVFKGRSFWLELRKRFNV